MEEDNVHQRVLRLRDVALGCRKSVSVDSSLAHASYECVVDSLLALYSECSGDKAGLARDKYVARFLSKYETAVKDLNKLRLTPEDFSVKAVIGRGHFGEVQVVREKSTGDVYAMKVMKKSHILQQADAAFFLEERDIMAWTNSQWLTSLHYAFQDSTHLYLVMDFHPGGDLLSVMDRDEGGMSELDARFYLTEIAAGLHDLHTLGFVHRDIKPENVLITRSGHIKLVDFGSAARLGPQGKVLESRLPVGTPEYIAPEVLTSLDVTADYGVCCDWWSLGIIAYELVYDVTPFTGGSTSETYGNIMNYEKSLSFPDGVEVSEQLRDLITRLLTSPASRLAYPGLKAHPFFSNTDWDRLQQTMPPYIPSVCAPDDTANFDEFETQRDCGDDHLTPPLSQRGQRGFSGRTLPFVGFTFTRMDSVNLDLNVTDQEHNVSRLQRKSSGRGGKGRGRGKTERESGLVVGRGEQETSELRRELDVALRELSELRERKSSLERECVIYQSQLEDFHRKLEIEKVERRMSDGQALQLLEEVREQGKIAQQLREGEARSTCEQLNRVIEQLEQERGAASKRARRLQEELQRIQQERDGASKKISEYKSKVAEVKQSGRKDITALQTKLAKVTKDSLSKVAEMQNRLTEAHARFSESSKRVQEVESEKRKLEFSLQQAQMGDSISSSEAARALTKKLQETEDARSKAEKEVADLKHQLGMKGQENSTLHSQCNQLAQQMKELEDQWQSANSRQEQLEASEWDLKTRLGQVSREMDKAVADNKQAERSIMELEKAVSKLQSEKQSLEDKLKGSSPGLSVTVREAGGRETVVVGGEMKTRQQQLADREKEVKDLLVQLEAAKKEAQQMRESLRSVQVQLSETSNLYIAQGDKLREVRRNRMELDQENTNLKTTLSRTRSEVKMWRRKFEEVSGELDGLGEVKKTASSLQKEIESLINRNKDAKRDVEVLKAEREQATVARQEAEATLGNSKKELEAQELSMALLQNKLSSVEEELNEARGTVEEERGREGEWREGREFLQTDLKTAEKRLEDAYAEIEKEKALRASLEKSLTDTLTSLEKTVTAHSEEQRRLADQLATQKQLASKYSDRVSQLEKDTRLKGLELREAQKELETEKSLSSKFYDDLHSLHREHGKLKAAHVKMLQESTEKTGQLSQETSARERAMEEQRAAVESHMIQETKLQATIAQQNKLIDFLQNSSPPSRGSRLRFKGLRLGRKSRDPAKEIAEWKKIKGLAAKPTSKDVPGHPATLPRAAPSSSSLPSVRLSSSRHSLASTTSIPSTSFSSSSSQIATPASATNKYVVHLPPTHGDTSGSSTSHSFSPGGGLGLATPTTASQGEGKEGVCPPLSSSLSSSRQSVVVKRLSVNIHRKSTDTTSHDEQMEAATPQKAGTKRGLEVSTRQSSRPGLEHNIPHRFLLKSAPVHKTYTCSFCKSTIKPMQKFVKCSHCGQVCHQKCSNQTPNNCGLPAELVDFNPPKPSPSKKLRWEMDEREKKKEEGGEGEGKGEGKVKQSQSSGAVRRPEETVKMGRVYVLKGEVKSECWLVLTDSSLQCHDRHPAGVTRKPLVCFSWTDPQSLVVVVRNVDSRPISYVSSTKHQHLMFAVEQHSAAEGVKRGVFITEALEEKEEWIVAIESAIMRSSGVVDSSSSTESSAAAASLRSGVTVTPVSRTQRLARKRSRPASTPCTTSSPDSSVI